MQKAERFPSSAFRSKASTQTPSLTAGSGCKMTSTTTMKGILIEKTGGVEVLQYKTDLPVPVPGEGEILVKNDFIGVNFIDTYAVMPPPHPLSPIQEYIRIHTCV
jgi:hypothetical protein